MDLLNVGNRLIQDTAAAAAAAAAAAFSGFRVHTDFLAVPGVTCEKM